MSSILKGIQLNEVNPHHYDSDWDYQDAVANSGRPRFRSSDSYDAFDAENDAYEMHKRFAATRARKEAEAKAAAEKAKTGEQGVAEGSESGAKILYTGKDKGGTVTISYEPDYIPGHSEKYIIRFDGKVKSEMPTLKSAVYGLTHYQFDTFRPNLQPNPKTALEQGVAEGSEQVYKVLAVDKSNALSKQVKLKVKASSLDEVFERLAINDWYPLEINGVEVINGKRLKQGVAEEQLDELSPQTLASYKKKAGADATAADKRGDYDRGDKRMSGIVKATKKEFDNDAKGVSEESKGLWANIHAKQERIKHGSGEHMRKPGSKGAPTADAFSKSAVSESAILQGLKKL